MPAYPTTKRIGIFLSIAACALFVGAQSKDLISSPDKTLNEEPASEELGVESAWPHLRNDFAS